MKRILNFLQLVILTRETAAQPFNLFKSSCDECSAQHDCQDVAVELYRNLAPYRGQRHVPQLIEMFFELEHRFFCLKGHSNVDFRFELPIPDLNLATIPALLAFDAKQELALSVLAVRDRYVAGYDQPAVPSQVEKFISQLGFSDETNLLQFLSEYLMLAEFAYIERNLEVISILPSLLVALTESASAEELTELLESSGRNKRLYEMLVYVGLQDSIEPAGDSEHTTDLSRFVAIMNFIRDSNSQFEENLEEIKDPNAHPEYFQQAVENDYNVEQPSAFNPAILFVMSKDEEPFSVEEFIFILQSAPSLAQDPVIPYLFMKDADQHDKLRTYLMARLLTPELFQNNGNNMSTALALLQ